MMRAVTVVLWGVCCIASADDVPERMTMLTVKFESPEISNQSFAAQPKRMYRAGSRFCRIEENPDMEQGIHGLVVINEPDVWMVNRLAKTGKHMVDSGPKYDCRLPMFANAEDVKAPTDIKKALMELEFGREMEYFRRRSGGPKPGPVLRDQPTTVYATEVGDSQLFLFTSGKPETPVAVVRKDDKTREIFWYGEYVQLPFDAKLFGKPEGIPIEEAKQ